MTSVPLIVDPFTSKFTFNFDTKVNEISISKMTQVNGIRLKITNDCLVSGVAWLAVVQLWMP